ncbi:MAG: carbohydrate-binding domain-containing protein [Erysipelotrichaceae bacterium]|nr:carbohydrate-binding domain-containing protein [Erysipelotrichaceae bacterium]
MKRELKYILMSLVLALALSACANTTEDTTKEVINPVSEQSDVTVIELNGDSATVNGIAVKESDYTWHVDPTEVHEDNSKAPAEYYTGTKIEDETIYIDHELYYYPALDLNDYKLINYDGEKEYAYYYADGVNEDYIFATLPNFSTDILESMMHTEEEAAENKVLRITTGGTYELTGTFNGQIRFECSEEEKLTVTLNGVDITCTVAPGIIFDAYECGGDYENGIDNEDIGVKVILEGDNTVTGCNIYRMLSNTYKTDSTSVQKKVRKVDAPFYSYVTMSIEGDGSLTVNSNFEGLDTEMHLILLSGDITINSVDDGINVNEDNVSVVSFEGANVTINHASGSEGDGIDSNGYIKVSAGTISVNGVTSPDNALDSEDGVYYTGGTIIVDNEEVEMSEGTYREVNGNNQGFGGGRMDRPDGTGRPEDMGDFNPDDMGNFKGGMMGQFEELYDSFDITEFKKQVADLDDNATLDDVLDLFGITLR